MRGCLKVFQKFYNYPKNVSTQLTACSPCGRIVNQNCVCVNIFFIVQRYVEFMKLPNNLLN